MHCVGHDHRIEHGLQRLRDKGRDRSGRVQDRSGRVQKRPGRVQKQPGRKRWLSSLTYSDLIEALDAA